MDKFPGWSRVDVTTGWMSRDGQRHRWSLDARIQTDPERFWDQYQAKILPRIYDHVMKVTENRPLPDKQPFHRDLDVEVWMSEPDFRIGVDEELVSSLESLHEDLYFVTLDFFDALGRTTTRRRLAAPGKIYPIIHPERRGQTGQVRVLYAGNASTKPQLESPLHGEGRAESRETIRRELTKIDTTSAAAQVTAWPSFAPMRVSEIELRSSAKDDREAAPRRRCARRTRAPARGRPVSSTALSYDRVDAWSRRDCAEGHAHASRRSRTPARAAPSNVHRTTRRSRRIRWSRGTT